MAIAINCNELMTLLEVLNEKSYAQNCIFYCL